MEHYPWLPMVWGSDQAYKQAKAMGIFCHEGLNTEGIAPWDVCVGHRVLSGEEHTRPEAYHVEGLQQLYMGLGVGLGGQCC